MVVAALAMGATMFAQCGRGGGPGGVEQGDAANAIATVNGFPVSGERIQAVASQQPSSSATEQATSLAQTTNSALRLVALQSLLAKEPALTAEEIEKAAGEAFDGKIEQARYGLMMSGKLKPTATPADFEKAIKVQTGKTPAELKKEQVEGIKKAFADPSTKPGVALEFAEPILAARLGAKMAGDDASLRDSYRTYVVKRLFFSDRSGSSESAKARAKKAQAALKSGTAFDKLMDTVSNDPAPTGKAAHDATQDVPSDALSGTPDLSALKGKSPLTTTDVIDVPGGKAIYMLSAVRDNVPPDFEKDKAKYRAVRASTAGRTALQQKIDGILKSDVTWTSPGFHALAAAADPTTVAEAAALAQTALKSENPSERRLGAQALLIATKPGEPGHVAALEAAQKAGIEDAGLSLELAKAYGDKKDGAQATAALIAASKGNSRYDAQGDQLFRDIAGAALDLQKKGVLTKEQLTQVQSQQAIWTNARKENEGAQAEAKRQAAAAQKANDAEIARQKAEAAKNAPKATAPPTGVTITPGSGLSGGVPGASTAPTTGSTTGGSLLPTTTGGGAGK